MDTDKCYDCGHNFLPQPCCYKHRVEECTLITKKQLKDWEREQSKKVLEWRDLGYDVYFDLYTRQFIGQVPKEII